METNSNGDDLTKYLASIQESQEDDNGGGGVESYETPPLQLSEGDHVEISDDVNGVHGAGGFDMYDFKNVDEK